MERLVSYKELAEHYGLTLGSMYQRVYLGRAPTPVRTGAGRIIGWRPEEIQRWDQANQMTRPQYLYQKDRQ